MALNLSIFSTYSFATLAAHGLHQAILTTCFAPSIVSDLLCNHAAHTHHRGHKSSILCGTPSTLLALPCDDSWPSPYLHVSWDTWSSDRAFAAAVAAVAAATSSASVAVASASRRLRAMWLRSSIA
mmetsp:Transcript_19674/g.59662  ORF Transcript_19674/g.59662 Transcript_19674/m.59662 type:complete len:126 (-) Transcript_19674:293-670(-)